MGDWPCLCRKAFTSYQSQWEHQKFVCQGQANSVKPPLERLTLKPVWTTARQSKQNIGQDLRACMLRAAELEAQHAADMIAMSLQLDAATRRADKAQDCIHESWNSYWKPPFPKANAAKLHRVCHNEMHRNDWVCTVYRVQLQLQQHCKQPKNIARMARTQGKGASIHVRTVGALHDILAIPMGTACCRRC